MSPTQMLLLGATINVAAGCIAAVNQQPLLAAVAFIAAGLGLLALAVMLALTRRPTRSRQR